MNRTELQTHPLIFESSCSFRLVVQHLKLAGFGSPRKAQSLVARAVCSEILDLFGLTNVDIKRGEHGEPLWPAGFSGSISHCLTGDKQALIAVALCQSSHLVGIDIEALNRLDQMSRVKGLVFNSEEENLLVGVGQYGLLVGFSAKETLYKALYPIVKKPVWFSAVRLVAASRQILQFAPTEKLKECGVTSLPEVHWQQVADEGILTVVHG